MFIKMHLFPGHRHASSHSMENPGIYIYMNFLIITSGFHTNIQALQILKYVQCTCSTVYTGT